MTVAEHDTWCKWYRLLKAAALFLHVRTTIAIPPEAIQEPRMRRPFDWKQFRFRRASVEPHLAWSGIFEGFVSSNPGVQPWKVQSARLVRSFGKMSCSSLLRASCRSSIFAHRKDCRFSRSINGSESFCLSISPLQSVLWFRSESYQRTRSLRPNRFRSSLPVGSRYELIPRCPRLS